MQFVKRVMQNNLCTMRNKMVQLPIKRCVHQVGYTVAMTIAQLQQMRPLLNLAELARRAGMNEQSLFAKVRRSSELSVVESEALEGVLEEIGLNVIRRK
jgi:hypothetical protein